MSAIGGIVSPREWREEEAVVLVKAAPLPSSRYKETVCCAAMTDRGEWLRLYPIRYRVLPPEKRFRRWDRIRFRWRPPTNDSRPESRRINEDSLVVLGRLKERERGAFVAPSVVDSLKAVRRRNMSFALLRVEILEFIITPKPASAYAKEKRRFQAETRQGDLLESGEFIPYRPCPFRFQYRYDCADGERTGTCQDWETDATFFRWRYRYGQEKALALMHKRFGEEYRSKGVLFAMGTHFRYRNTWLINGIIRVDVPAYVQTRMDL